MALLDEACKAKLIAEPIMSNDEIDLHGLTYGSAYFILKRKMFELLKSADNELNINIIYGKGLHSKRLVEVHSVKDAVLRLVRELKINFLSEGEEDESNAGVFHLRLLIRMRYNLPR